jgi:hypothetical protein
MNLLSYRYHQLTDEVRAIAARIFPTFGAEALAPYAEDERSVAIAVEKLLVKLRIFPLIAGVLLVPFLNIENVLSVYVILVVFALETVFWGDISSPGIRAG